MRRAVREVSKRRLLFDVASLSGYGRFGNACATSFAAIRHSY